jgi:uncharacterized protein YcnI
MTRCRAAVAACVVTAAFVLMAPPAWAHVTVHPSTLVAGSSDVELTFRVPNERDDANTVTVQVFFPTNLPLLTVEVLPVPGWTATVHTQNLSTPVQTDDGPVSQVVSDVTWKAMGGGTAPGQYEDFDVAAGSVPNHPGPLVFKALQTYSSGEIVRWIEVPVAGQPDPATPAPVLTLTAPTIPSGSTGLHHVAVTTPGSSDGLAIAALVLGGVNLVAAGALVARSRKRRTAA